MKFISGLLNIFRRKDLKEIFTPNTIAKLAYVRRGEIEENLLSNITIPGKQIILYGHSGSGKTTLIRKMLYDKKINFESLDDTINFLAITKEQEIFLSEDAPYGNKNIVTGNNFEQTTYGIASPLYKEDTYYASLSFVSNEQFLIDA